MDLIASAMVDSHYGHPRTGSPRMILRPLFCGTAKKRGYTLTQMAEFLGVSNKSIGGYLKEYQDALTPGVCEEVRTKIRPLEKIVFSGRYESWTVDERLVLSMGFGVFVRHIRGLKGLTQDQVCEGLSEYETGRRRPSKSKRDEILDKLGIEIYNHE